MRVLLAIPSKARASTLQKYALTWLALLPETVEWQVFVEPQDEGAYKSVVPDGHLSLLTENDRGLGFALSQVKAFAITGGYDVIFKLDDDIRGFMEFRQRLNAPAVARRVTKMVEEFSKAFETFSDLGAITFPYSFEVYDKTQWQPTKRVQTAYFVRTSAFFAEPAVSVFEDFAVGLYCLTKGLRVMRYGLSAIDLGVKVGGGTGGHQSVSLDRKAGSLAAIEELRKIYPPLECRAVDKPWGIEPDLKSVKL